MPIIQQSVVEVTGIRNDRLNACPTTDDQYFTKLVGQAFSLSGLLPTGC